MDIDEVVETSDVEELEEELCLRRASSLPLEVEGRAKGPYLEQINSSPPRKRLKVFHEGSRSPPIEPLRRLSVSPSKSMLPNRELQLSQSSSTAYNPSSPRWQSASTRSPSRTSFEDLASPGKQERGSLPHVDYPQAPLSPGPLNQHPAIFLATPTRSPLAALPQYGNQSTPSATPGARRNPSTPSPKTPPYSPPEHQRHLATPNSYLGHKATHTPSLFVNAGAQGTEENGNEQVHDLDNDELLLFTPTEVISAQRQLSPMSPLTQRSLSPLSVRSSPVQNTRNLTPTYGSPMGSLPSSPMPIIRNPPPPAPAPPGPDDNPIDMNHIPEESRYSLRKRNVAQLNPYTVENMRYQRALQSNPEAIVKMKALERLNHHHSGNHYAPDGETQTDLYLDEGAPEDEDAGWGEMERKRLELRANKERRRQERALRQASAEQDKARYPEILRDLTDSDDEEMTALEKEARRAARRKEKEERARLKGKQREGESKLYKKKRFPAPPATPPSRSKSHKEDEDEDVEMVDDAGHAGSSRLPSQNAEDRALHDYFRGYGDSGSDANGVAGPSNNARQSSAPASVHGDVYQDLFGDDMDMQQDDWGVGEFGQDIAARGSSKAPYTIESDAEQAYEGRKPSQVSNKVSDIELDLPPQKERWLRRMLPKGMWHDRGSASAKAKKAKRAERRAQSSIASDGDAAGPLLPGQTRVQKAANPKDIRDIKGDSESESQTEDRRTPTPEPAGRIAAHSTVYESDSGSDAVEILKSYFPPAAQLVEKEQVDYYSEDEIDDQDIQNLFFPTEMSAPVRHVGRSRDESLIDYMLTRCRYIGGERKAQPKPRTAQQGRQDNGPNKPSKYKIDVTTRGARGHGHERQTLLSFNKHQEAKKPQDRTLSRVSSSRSLNEDVEISGHRKNSSHPTSNIHRNAKPHHRTASGHRRSNNANSSKRTSGNTHHIFPDDADGDDDDDDFKAALNPTEEDHMPDVPNEQRLNWKEREKARKKRARMNGIWSNNTAAHKVVSSGIGKTFTTVTIEKEATIQLEKRFQFALAPKNATQAQRDHWSKKFKPPPSPPRRIQKGRSERPAVEDKGGDEEEVVDHLPSRKTEKWVGMGVRVLTSGRNFAASTSIGKGWLYELVNLAAGLQEPARPLSVTLCGFSLDPGVELEAFCEVLPQVTDSFFDFATALPDLDQDMLNTQWASLAHIVSQHISWFLKAGQEQQTTTLRKVVETQIVQIVDRIKGRALKFIDTPAMILGWFSVEMSARLVANTAPPSTLSADKLLKVSSISLMNLLLQFGIDKTMEPIQQKAALDGSEASHYASELWVCLIHVYTTYLPQEVAAKPQTHPLWPVLLEALRLHVDKEILEPAAASETAWFTIYSLCALSQFSAHGTTIGLPRLTAYWDSVLFALKQISLESTPDEKVTKAERRRDAYIATVVKRCLRLHERWGWKLQDPSKLFNELANIFRSRKFCNLRLEKCDFPDFVKLADPTLLSLSDNTDTAFMVFLKLIVRAAREDPIYIARGSSPKVKKWLSIAVPVGDVPLPKHIVKDEIQHTLSMFYNRLAAVAVAVELDPTDYDDRTEKIRHYINFANASPTTRFAIIRALMYWSSIMVARKVKLTPVLGWIEEIATIIGSELKKFPAKSKPPTTDDPKDEGRQGRASAIMFVRLLMGCVRQIFAAHIKARVYPEPSLIVALKPMLTPWSTSEREGPEIKALQEAFGNLGISLFQARALVLPPPSRPPRFAAVNEESQESQDFGMDDLGDLDWDSIALPEALAGTADHAPPDFAAEDKLLLAALKSVQFRWTVIPLLNPRLTPPPDDGILRKAHESESLEPQAEKWHDCLRLLDLKFTNLKVEADEPWTTEDRAMEALLLALISDRVSLEKEYVAHFLSISSLRHPLLHGVSDLPPRSKETGDFSFSPAEFQNVRTLLLKAIFQKVNEVIQKQARGDESVALDAMHFLQMVTTMLSTMRARLTSSTSRRSRK
ncbi:hypothetical protein HYPSUDRAFT_79351 [Hypholoma sublateritium FD-334 SS-4]|uniref:Uncharacterized protein n=1 Tax=Hypholoma sublateritium (strain FD-334 SS-4) TaxID=945553 RepID=A0A0D2PCP1_HYPSF|nr:hypothetical protein HYPSUDRAFT_79351 [Hypholoma sublateritium FD-334 SS-4]